MSALVTLAVAKKHLRIPLTTIDSDDDVLRKMDQASAIILDYLKVPVTSPPLYTETTVPAHIQAAILLMLTRLFEQRGDDEKADADCWLAIERLLMRSRDPALA